MTHLGGHALYLTQRRHRPGQPRGRPGHRPRAGADVRRHHGPHVQPPVRRGPRPTRRSAGHQRPDGLLPPLPGDGRPDDRPGAFRRRWPDGRWRSSATATTSPAAWQWRARSSSMNFILACPAGYELEDALHAAERLPAAAGLLRGARPGRRRRATPTSSTPTRGSPWARRTARSSAWPSFAGFQINAQLLAAAPAHADRHALPAGLPRVSRSPTRSSRPTPTTILEEAENRLHFQRTLLNVLINREEF